MSKDIFDMVRWDSCLVVYSVTELYRRIGFPVGNSYIPLIKRTNADTYYINDIFEGRTDELVSRDIAEMYLRRLLILPTPTISVDAANRIKYPYIKIKRRDISQTTYYLCDQYAILRNIVGWGYRYRIIQKGDVITLSQIKFPYDLGTFLSHVE